MTIYNEAWLRAYFDDIGSRRPGATSIPLRLVKFANGTEPRENHCHENVDQWIIDNPDQRPMRGWLVSAGAGAGFMHLFAAHSIVTDGYSEFDITPLPYPCSFIRHAGSGDDFIAACAGRSEIWWPRPAPSETPPAPDLDDETTIW